VKDAERCSVCGAIFVIDGGSFSCPACGSSVGESEAGCPNCGEHFRQFTPRTCPVCGRPVGQNEEKCQCGAIMGDKCPECGASLAQEDTVCANCGAAFEFI
jgi:predicted amidophosphoribosyltransferase